MKNCISSITIDHYSVFGNGTVDITIRRRPWRRKHAPGYNSRRYSSVSTPSSMRLISIANSRVRNGKAVAKRQEKKYGTQVRINIYG